MPELKDYMLLIKNKFGITGLAEYLHNDRYGLDRKYEKLKREGKHSVLYVNVKDNDIFDKDIQSIKINELQTVEFTSNDSIIGDKLLVRFTCFSSDGTTDSEVNDITVLPNDGFELRYISEPESIKDNNVLFIINDNTIRNYRDMMFQIKATKVNNCNFRFHYKNEEEYYSILSVLRKITDAINYYQQDLVNTGEMRNVLFIDTIFETKTLEDNIGEVKVHTGIIKKNKHKVVFIDTFMTPSDVMFYAYLKYDLRNCNDYDFKNSYEFAFLEYFINKCIDVNKNRNKELIMEEYEKSVEKMEKEKQNNN